MVARGIEAALERARAGREQAEADLFELIRIPSVSSLTRHRPDCLKAAEWLVVKLQAMGMTARTVSVYDDGHRLIEASWTRMTGAPTLTIYGHYDVQPPDPLEEWTSAPFEPTLRDGFVYARGSDDNKGQLMCSVKAAEHAFAGGGPPLNLRFLIEGEEEITGPSLPSYVRQNAADLATDYLFIADGQFTAAGMPNLLTGLRGLLYTEIEVEGAAADLHSGIYGGVAPNPFNSLAHILSALKGRDGRITVPGFYDHVRPPEAAELEAWSRLPAGDADLRSQLGVTALEGEQGYSPFERRWSRPTLDVHGVIGGFIEEGKKTVIPARARAKVSMRLVPDQDPAPVLESLRAYAPTLATPGVRVTVHDLGQARPVRMGTQHPGVPAASRAFQAAFGAEPVFVREGGSIPVTVDFQEALHPHLLVTGFGLPGDALHSPNERYSLDQYHRGIEMVLHLMWELAR
jgi:acetylornithine deacetylase/succinyl-diaminopimelate desuccinylase-like protein